MKEKEVIINISGREYSIVSDQEDYIRRLELYVNAMAKNIGGDNPDLSYTKLLVLTCMYLADEVFKSKKTAAELLDSLDEDVRNLIARNERILEAQGVGQEKPED